MEIERKWLVAGWPEGAVPSHTYRMDQGYIALSPTVRIRREAEGCVVRHVLCFKGKADAAGLAREEIEQPTGISVVFYHTIPVFSCQHIFAATPE